MKWNICLPNQNFFQSLKLFKWSNFEQNKLEMNNQKISHHHTLVLYKFLLVTRNEIHFVFFEDQT